MKLRHGPDGLHLFDRGTGLNVLIEEFKSPHWSLAPRQVSIALTNICDLQCHYCYAPKQRASLDYETVIRWLDELDKAGCFGIGFGGGEPTLHPRFADICRYASDQTALAVTFTTHGHRLRPELLSRISGCVHFIRVSVDGTKDVYERLRGRSFEHLVERLRDARAVASLGINVVVNADTLPHLSAIADLATDLGASELLLLPQRATGSAAAAEESVRQQLGHWIRTYAGKVRLATNEADADGVPICDPLPGEKGLRSYAHIDASGVLKRSSYDASGVAIGSDGVLSALGKLGMTSGGML